MRPDDPNSQQKQGAWTRKDAASHTVSTPRTPEAEGATVGLAPGRGPADHRYRRDAASPPTHRHPRTGTTRDPRPRAEGDPPGPPEIGLEFLYLLKGVPTARRANGHLRPSCGLRPVSAGRPPALLPGHARAVRSHTGLRPGEPPTPAVSVCTRQRGAADEAEPIQDRARTPWPHSRCRSPIGRPCRPPRC
jgi:hypothetical protein